MRPALFSLVAALGFCAATAPAMAQAVDCTAFLTGAWETKGDVTMFGTTTTVDNDAAYNADGTFETISRYLGADGVWVEQAMTGTWTAGPGDADGECDVFMATEFDAGNGMTGSSSATTTVLVVDADTYSAFGVDAVRVGSEAAAATAPVNDFDCTGYLTGRWRTQGEIDLLGSKVAVDNVSAFNADGSFASDSTFLGADGVATAQALQGNWTARPGTAEGTCVLSTTGSASSSSLVTIIDDDSYGAFDLEAHRLAE